MSSVLRYGFSRNQKYVIDPTDIQVLLSDQIMNTCILLELKCDGTLIGSDEKSSLAMLIFFLYACLHSSLETI